ncbi:MAG: DUF4345 family protein [Proteobacteria bacterium]|nr:DUF4345 family protein [Pseudomonadota bacterium]
MEATRVLRIVSTVLVGFGLFALAMPEAMADLANLTVMPGQGDGWGEIGALYGGMLVAMGGVALYAMRESFADRATVMGVLAVLWLGVAAGRLLVMLVTAPEPSGLMGWINLGLELGLAGVYGLLGWKQAA